MPRSRSARSSTPSRKMHTAAPAAPHQAPPANYSQPTAATQPRQPGLFAQMATTAAGVAVGSAVGHTLANGVSSIFGGGSGEPAQQQPQQQYAQVPQQQQYTNQTNDACAMNMEHYVKCLNTSNDANDCRFLLEALNDCKAAARSF